jgi:hypothetical protein
MRGMPNAMGRMYLVWVRRTLQRRAGQIFSCVLACALLVVTAIRASAQDTVRLDGTSSDPRVAGGGVKAVVIVFTSTDCPISNRYAPEIRRLVARFGPSGIAFRLVYPNPSETRGAIHEHRASYDLQHGIEAFRDPEQALAKSSGATVTPEAVVYSGGRVVYRGRIDDRYVDLGRERPSATVHDLADALDAVLTGKPVANRQTQAVGCFIADFKR